jgi:hypothetical protein
MRTITAVTMFNIQNVSLNASIPAILFTFRYDALLYPWAEIASELASSLEASCGGFPKYLSEDPSHRFRPNSNQKDKRLPSASV